MSMKSIMRLVGLASVFSALLCGSVFAAGEALAPKVGVDKIVVTTNAAPRETRSYKVLVKVKGMMPAADGGQPTSVDVSYSIKLLHSYLRRQAEGMLPLDISVKEAEITANGESLTVSPATFPKLTAMFDRDWQLTGLFGVAGSSYEKSIPGINYGNLIMLFFLHGGNKPHAVGETWRARLKLPCYPETYDFAVTLKSLDELNGAKVATVHEDISWAPDKQSGASAAIVKASAESEFALDDGKLIGSHVDCDIQFAPSNKAQASQQDSAPYHANIKLDIALAK